MVPVTYTFNASYNSILGCCTKGGQFASLKIMLEAERRHTSQCNERQKTKHEKNHKEPLKFSPKELKKCNCPLRVVGVDIRGKWHRESLGTRDLFVAGERIRKLELGEPVVARLPDVPIVEAFAKYTSIIQSQRDVKDTTVRFSVNVVRDAIVRFAQERYGDKPTMNQITETDLDDMIATWNDLAVSTRRLRIQITKAFFSLCASRKLVARDPSMLLVCPRQPSSKCTLPFDLEKEDPRIIHAIPRWHEYIANPKSDLSTWAKHPHTGAAFLYVLRFTGLRISDAIFFEPRMLVKRIVEGNDVYCYFLARQEKTDEPVFVIIRPDVAEYIINAPRLTEEYAFYDPEGHHRGTEGGYEHIHQWCARIRASLLKFLERASGVPDIRPHRFRDTFSVDFLKHAGDIRALSRLLGHKSVSTTLDYYEHWIPGDQLKAVKAMMSTWQTRPNIIPFPVRKQA